LVGLGEPNIYQN